MPWYIYIVKCVDGSLYTGVTTDVIRRVTEHNGGGGAGKGAKYTKMRRPVQLVYHEPHPDRSSASIREAVIKKLHKLEKQALIDKKH